MNTFLGLINLSLRGSATPIETRKGTPEKNPK